MKRTIFFIVLLFVAVGFIAKNVVNISDTEKPAQEVVSAAVNMSDEYIIEKFDEAYNFWVCWVYGQQYRAYDDNHYRESVTIDSPIQSSSQLREEMEKYFTSEMTDKYFVQLQPEDRDGKLYINTRDVGGPYSGPNNITVDKINQERYRLNLDIWSYMDVEDPDMSDECVYYVFKDGKWVFENDSDNEFFYSWS